MTSYLPTFAALGFTVILAVPVAAADLDETIWRVTLESARLGPIEMQLRLEENDGELFAESVSGALDLIRALPGAQAADVHLEGAPLAFSLTPNGVGYRGTTTAPWAGHEAALVVEDEQISGSIDGGLLSGSFKGVRIHEAGPVRDYRAVLEAIDRVIAAKVFDPSALETAAYRIFRRRLGEVARSASDDLDLLLGCRFAWTNDPFSHFELRRAPVTAEQMMHSFDDYRVGYEAARVVFHGDIAVLTVDTMMGNDTIEQIEAAYKAIAAAGTKALVIDLRGNEGGAFAVKPLVEHVIDQPLDAGYFVSQKWNRSNDRLPTSQELATIEPWAGWSISAFWRSVQDEGLLRIRFDPAEPNFDGPVFVVVDGRSASATELATDAFRASGGVILVGERTVGQMLSQSFFDATEGFVVSLPVADYISVAHGRIEGVGVGVDVDSPSAEALDDAMALARVAIDR